ncbi:MAG: glutathione S-transferase N-terminal domain-containing protein [Phenylobacterium sp.]
MPAPIDVYFWPTPNGTKITLALEEMGLDYTLVPVNIGRGDQFKPEFLAISPNNRMPAIVDPDGPDGEPISVFESGAILQYLGRKTGKFYPQDERGRVQVEEWLYWQMAGLGPMAGQANHFRSYARLMLADQRQVAYGTHRYVTEYERLAGVLNTRLKGREFVAGDYSIADMACYPWVRGMAFLNPGIHEGFDDLLAWIERIGKRDAVARADQKGRDLVHTAAAFGAAGEQARNVLFGQRARR